MSVKSQQLEILKKRRDSIKEEIFRNLDLLIGSVGKSPAMSHHNLTTKVGGKTVSRYLRKGLVPKAQIMTRRHKTVRKLIQELSTVNWELLKLESE